MNVSDAQDKTFIEDYDKAIELFEEIEINPSKHKSYSNWSPSKNLEHTISLSTVNEKTISNGWVWGEINDDLKYGWGGIDESGSWDNVSQQEKVSNVEPMQSSTQKPIEVVSKNTSSFSHFPCNVETTRFRAENIEQINEIVNHLQNDDFIVYGNWLCQWPRKCGNGNEWQIKYSRESLKTYLKLSLRLQHEFFTKPCEKCKNRSLITSFFLYDRPPRRPNSEPTVEIICHLEWNNHYRVIAEWACETYSHKWHSSYTWISLQKFIEQTPADFLSPNDFYMQKCFDCKNGCAEEKCIRMRRKCNECKKKRERCSACRYRRRMYQGCKECDHDGIILNYETLVHCNGKRSHKDEICAKCLEGVRCTQTDYHHRTQRKRYINLLI
ncbi:233_t:CDS:2 [Funneliformis mosseae]|uniref:233_t:CDS:1 n=1 Tax=Funneliformis mosseae TaxID=27381 RepID=A0A9N8ZGL6_FUNMO|nr:233_t:CDS:2 [Funneliformis mosseae]